MAATKLAHILLLGAAGVATTAAHAADPLRVLLVTGGHSHELSFYSLLAQDDFKVTVDGHPSAYNGDLRKRADVLVLYDMAKTEADAPRRARLREFAESGKGIVVLHHALCSHTDWPWYYEALAGGGYVFSERPGAPVSTFSHDETIRVTKAMAHPVVDGLPAEFTLVDETYKSVWMAPGNRILLRTDHPKSDGPVAWLPAYSKSRVVAIQLGHDRTAHLDANYRILVRNAVRWAGGHKQ
jgi:type 1 glutamine amidotransferase